ncbi:disulfide bond formation protein B [Bordetella trematum]|uniref:disulfide bond formation protein B n=1 Tax=Bordetella trematum TaxID=123899 RepID=UPI003D0D27D0
MTFTRQRLLLLIALFCFAAVGLALLSQHVFDMPPCAWCVLQRLVFVVIGVVSLIGALAPALARLGAALASLLALCGMAAALYQYTVAANMLSCDQTFADRFMTGTGLESALPWVFGIYATCMDAVVSVLGIEYALWSLALFVILFLMALPVALGRIAR